MATLKKQQIDRDRVLLVDGPEVDSIVWHFLPSAASGQIWSDPLPCQHMQDKGIAHVIHVPSSAR